jgi:hypothetical protein
MGQSNPGEVPRITATAVTKRNFEITGLFGFVLPKVTAQ